MEGLGWWVVAAVCVCGAGRAAGESPNLMRHNMSLHAFYRDMRATDPEDGSTRRMFGGAPTELREFGAVCALMDRYFASRCSGAIVSPTWVLTAAHCVTSRLAYVKYNTRQPSGNDGNLATIQFLYRHPKYRVVQADEGRGMDVTLLHHDVGLVNTKTRMFLKYPLAGNLFTKIRRYNPVDLHNKEVLVLGFGRTEEGSLGEQLTGVRLRLVFCERGAWFYCVCGVGEEARRAGRGVCSGDSGGPVIFDGMQVAVTSMGPLECSQTRSSPDSSATSVFTSLYNYADIINATMAQTELALRMSPIALRGVTPAPAALTLLALLLSHCLPTQYL